MSLNLFQNIADSVLTTTSTWTAIADTLVLWVMPVILTGLTIKIMWIGFNIIRGAGGQHHFLDVWAESLRAFLVVTLALSGAAYSSNVKGLLDDVKTSLIGLFVPGATTPYSAIDTAMDGTLQSFNTIVQWGQNNISIVPFDLSGLMAIVSSAFMVGCMFIYSFVSCVNLLLIDFSLALVYGLGPLFIACLAFQATSRFFDSWLAGALKYIFKAIVVSAIVAMANAIMFGYAAKLAANPTTIDFFSAAFSALGATGVLVILAMKGPELAADIIGGSGVSFLNPARAAQAISNAISPGAKAAAAAVGSPLAAGAMGAAQKVAGTMANTASYGAGAAAGGMARTSLGQRAIAATQSMQSKMSGNSVAQGMRNFGNAVSGGGRGTGSISGASNSGSGANSFTGQMGQAFQTGKAAVTPNQRPIPFPTLNRNI